MKNKNFDELVEELKDPSSGGCCSDESSCDIGCQPSDNSEVDTHRNNRTGYNNIISISQNDFEEEVLKSKIPVLLDFWAPWCNPCLKMEPVLEEIANEFSGKLKIVKINIDISENKTFISQYNIKSIPDIRLFKDGKIIKESKGFKLKQELVDELVNLIE